MHILIMTNAIYLVPAHHPIMFGPLQVLCTGAFFVGLQELLLLLENAFQIMLDDSGSTLFP